MEDTGEKVSATTPKEDTPQEVRKFTDEAREALKREGFSIFTLTGQSIDSLREQGKIHGNVLDEEARTQPSMSSEVAVRSYIDQSFNKSKKDHERLIAEFSKDLSKRVKGVEAIMGTPADYAEINTLQWAGLDSQAVDVGYARTTNPRIIVFGESSKFGCKIDDMADERPSRYVLAKPIVVPTN